MQGRNSTSGNDGPLTGPATQRDELFCQLSHPVRRRVLRELAAADPGAIFGIAEFVGDGDGTMPDRITLHHNHLPSLASAEYITWDRTADVVTRGPQFGTIEPVVHLLAEHDELLPGE